VKVTDSEPVAPSFGTLLRRYRLCAGLSQETLAERADLSVEAISTLERGVRRAPRAATVSLLSDALALDKAERIELASAVDRHRGPRQSRRIALKPLPASLTRLIGRDAELENVSSLMRERAVRLLTISGVGGVGKTRFALELAHRVAADFDDGAAFASLAAIRDPAHLGSALSQCLERENDDDTISFDALCARIANRRVLLVIDNFEHLLAGGPLLVDFLTRCPHSSIVVTSREALRVTGEHEFSLQPLKPDAAVALLIERSQAVRPDIDTVANAGTFSLICRRLDGLPLAIELAAARLRHYPVTVLLERLSSRLDALVSGARDAPVRQRTMRDAIDWSYQLLSESERTAFQICSLFAGGGTLDALAFVARSLGSTGAVDEPLMSVAEKHLVSIRDLDSAEIRFEMLETIRDYAHEQFVASGRAEVAQRAFAAYYGDLVRRAAPHLRGPDAPTWSAAISHEYENIRATLRWALHHDRSLGLLVTMDLHHFWSRSGYFTEAREWLEALGDPRDLPVALSDPKTVWEMLNLRALSYHWVGDYDRACPLFTDVLAFARILDDATLVARSLNNLGGALRNLREFDRARVVQEEALAIKTRQGDPWSIATSLSNLGLALRSCGQFDGALERHREALELFRSTSDRWGELAGLNDIADTYREKREFAQAASFYKASLDSNTVFKTLAADSFEGLATVCASSERFRQAATLGGAADTVQRQTGRSVALPDRDPFDAACAAARKSLGDREYDEAWADGASLSLVEAIEIARAIAHELVGTNADSLA
jgi:predicted ATPase/DNA-binding XRE family transcriptional regulator/Tfp pilus assembly protein PilF